MSIELAPVDDQLERGVACLKRTLLLAVQRDGGVPPAAEAEVHRMLDFISADGDHGEASMRLTQISCFLRQMNSYRLDGRINAHASTLLRLKRIATDL